MEHPIFSFWQLCVCRTSEHVDCVTHLLRQGANAFCMTSGGDNCLHMAARNAHSHCLWHLLAAWVSVRHKPPCHLADAVFSDDVSQLKYVDLPNGKQQYHCRCLWLPLCQHALYWLLLSAQLCKWMADMEDLEAIEEAAD